MADIRADSLSWILSHFANNGSATAPEDQVSLPQSLTDGYFNGCLISRGRSKIFASAIMGSV
jgi:hypothetical protein